MTRDTLTVIDGAPPSMRALVLAPGARRGGAGRLGLSVIARPEPPAPGWVRVRPTLAGIGSRDLALLSASNGHAGSAAARRPPLVPGTEVVGVVEEARATRWAREGQRVLLEPNAGCVIRGFPTCSRCAAGEAELCENRDRPSILGRAADGGLEAGGGWSEGVLAHEDMLVPADGISDQRGVLCVSLASAIHAVLRWSRRGDRVAVIGSGTTTRLVVASLCRLHPGGVDVSVVLDSRAAHRSGRRRRHMPSHLAGRKAVPGRLEDLGAARVWRGGSEEVLEHAADLLGSRRLRPAGSDVAVLDRGFDAVFDCRGTAASVGLAIRLARAAGTVVVAGQAGRLDLDWSAVWSRELTIAGSDGFGREPACWRTFAAVREWLTDQSFPADSLVTHRYPYDAFATAVETAAAGEAVGAIKVVFEAPSSALRLAGPAAQPEDADSASTPVVLGAVAARAHASAGSQSRPGG